MNQITNSGSGARGRFIRRSHVAWVRRAAVVGGFSLLGLFATAASATPRPIPISPGSADDVLVVDTTCPLFSWGGVAVAEGYRLEVVRLDAEGGATPVIRTELPKGSRSWQPDAATCLRAGERYAWSVRSMAGDTPGQRSIDSFFEVSVRPSAADAAMAMEILKRHRQAGSALVDPAETALAGFAEDSPQAKQRGANAVTQVEGRLQAGSIDLEPAALFFQGRLLADGDIESPSGEINTRLLTLTEVDNINNRLATFRTSSANRTVLCSAGSACESGSAGADGRLVVENFDASAGIAVGSGGLSISRNLADVGAGGSGFFSVPSAVNVNVDNNGSDCPAGRVMVGVRLAETDSDQIGVQVRCSAP